MPRKSPLLVPLLVAAALAAGCGDDGDASPEPDGTTTTTEPEATTTSIDPFTVPDDPADITVEYVEAVLTELEKINGDALRLAMSEGVTPAVEAVLAPILSPELLAFRMNTFVSAEAGGWEGVLEEPGDVRTDVQEVLVVGTQCLGLNVVEDFTDVAPSGAESVELRIELRRTTDNPTGWLYTLQQPRAGAEEPPEPCASE